MILKAFMVTVMMCSVLEASVALGWAPASL